MAFYNPTGFASYAGYSSVTPVGGWGMPPVQSQYYGGASSIGLMGYQPTAYDAMCYGPNYGYPYPTTPQQQNPAGASSVMDQFMQMLMLVITMLTGTGGPAAPGEVEGPPPILDEPPVDGSDPVEDTPPADERENYIAGEDPETASGALAILTEYKSELPVKNGRVTLKDLKKFVNDDSVEVPQAVKDAAQTIIDNEELYNILCLQSDKTPEKGFKLKALETDWDVEIDELESVDDDEAIDLILKQENYDAIQNIDGSPKITEDELIKVALGDVKGKKLRDPELQAAALRILSDEELYSDLVKKGKEQNKPVDPSEGRGHGDPHFVGEDGELYDVMGSVGKTYNILSDKHIQFNSTFEAWGAPGADGVQPTIMGQVGIQVNGRKVELNRAEDAPKIDGKKMEVGQEVDLGNGSKAKWDGKQLTINTPEYDIEVIKQDHESGAYLDHRVVAKDARGDGTNPHGILGQTFDADKDQKNNGTDLGKQGGTVIDGTVDDYEVSDLWGHNDKYNRFDPKARYDHTAF